MGDITVAMTLGVAPSQVRTLLHWLEIKSCAKKTAQRWSYGFSAIGQQFLKGIAIRTDGHCRAEGGILFVRAASD
jgi:hypothetical protein